MAVNTDNFINEYFQPKLHLYTRIYITVTWMEENVYFVEKASNPQNVPQDRLIENLEGILVQKVFERGWQASTQQELISRI